MSHSSTAPNPSPPPSGKPPKKYTANLWYKNYMVLVFVIGLPALVVVVCIFFIFYALKIQDSTVRDDWYMDGKALYADASKDQLAYDLGVSAVMTFEGQSVLLRLDFKDSNATFPEQLDVLISHATDIAQDQEFTLNRIQDNLYQGTLSIAPASAKYYIQVSDDQAGWRLMHAYQLPADKAILTPLPAFAKPNP